MNVVSLFDGMSCGQLALQKADIRYKNYYASEIDKYALLTSKHNFKDTTYIGDVRYVSGSKLMNVDLLLGGSPCQKFSFMGTREGAITKEKEEILTLKRYLELKREGFEFEGQSYLVWEYVRLLKKIKPKYFLLENVMMSPKWQAVITKALGVEPIEINSALVSAQGRKRLYWTNIPNVTMPEDKNIMLADILEEIEPAIMVHNLYGGFKETKCRVFETKSPTIRTGCGGGHLPSIFIGSREEARSYDLKTLRGLVRKVSVSECKKLQTVPDWYEFPVSNAQALKQLGNGWTIDVIAHIFSGMKEYKTRKRKRKGN